jgi:hypothetical protein
MKNNKNKQLKIEKNELEDKLYALKCGYYDTHDLDDIQEHKEEYEERLITIKSLLNKNY